MARKNQLGTSTERVQDVSTFRFELSYEAAPNHTCQCGNAESDRQDINPYGTARNPLGNLGGVGPNRAALRRASAAVNISTGEA